MGRKALHGASFPDTDALTRRIPSFRNWHNLTTQPFNWTWTRTQLNNYLHRLSGFDTTT
jgi:hypothetical protein